MKRTGNPRYATDDDELLK